MRKAGLNVVRIYHAPPPWFLDRCTKEGMRVLVTLPWENILSSCAKDRFAGQITEAVRVSVSKYPGHPHLGYLVGNEISSTMARWLGARRVIEFVEELICIGRAIDPDALFSYATYPPTKISATAEFRFLLLQCLSSQSARFRRLPAATAKSDRRAVLTRAQSAWTRSGTHRTSKPKCSAAISIAS